YRDSDLAAARNAWQQQSKPPAGPTELAMIADLESETGSDSALAVIEQLRAYQPGEADALLATLRFRQAKLEDATAALEAAFANYRSDPWALFRFKERAMALGAAIGSRRPDLAMRLFEALKQPFAVKAMQDERLATVATLTRWANFTGL